MGKGGAIKANEAPFPACSCFPAPFLPSSPHSVVCRPETARLLIKMASLLVRGETHACQADAERMGRFAELPKPRQPAKAGGTSRERRFF